MTIPDRAVRCLRLVVSNRGANRCESEQLLGSDYCGHHLAEAVRQFQEITAEVALGDQKENS